MSNESWYDLVVRTIEEIRAAGEADRREQLELYHYLNDARATRDGETVEGDSESIKCGYKGRHAFAVSVTGGKYIVRLPDGSAETFTQRDEAVQRMARLMAPVVMAEG